MGYSYGPSIVKDGMVLCLDAANRKSYAGSGTSWVDLSGSGNNGTLVNGPTFSSTNGGNIIFDGSNDHATVTGTPLNVNSYTKQVWFMLDRYDLNNNIISSGTGHFMFFGGTNKLKNGHSNWSNYDVYPSNASFSLSTWYNVCLTFNTTDGFVLYVNGQRDSVYTAQKTAAPSGTVQIACFNAGQNLLGGKIAFVALYNRTLTESESIQNYHATKGRFGL